MMTGTVWHRADGTYVIDTEHGEKSCHVTREWNESIYDEVVAYAETYPDRVIPEPADQMTDAQRIEKAAEKARNDNISYLASTDWYAIRFADTGVPIPADVKAARQAARDAL